MRFFIILVLGIHSHCFAQYKVTHYNTENGLPHDLCYQIIQDKQGFIWLGTDNGLVKFNGSTFQNYNRNQGLINSFVIDVFEDNDQKLVATWGGGCYSFDGNIFSPISLKKANFSKQQQIVKNNNIIYSIENRYRINSYNTITKKSQFYSFFKINNKLINWYSDVELNKNRSKLGKESIAYNIQIEKIDNEVYCFTDKNSPQFKGILRLNNEFKKEYSFSFLNQFEIIGLNKYKSHFKAITPTFIIEFNKDGIIKIENKNFQNLKILQYSENNSFKVYLLQNVKTNSHEILIEDLKLKSSTCYNVNFLKSPISDILISKDSSIWISTYGNGLFLIQKQIIQIDKNILKGNYVFDFIEKPRFNYFLTENTLNANNKLDNSITKFPIETIAQFRNRDNDTIIVINKNAKQISIKHENQIIKTTVYQNQITVNNQKIKYGDSELIYLKNNIWEKFNFNLEKEELLFLKIKKFFFYEGKYWVFTNYGIFILDDKFNKIRHYIQQNGLLQNDVITASIHQNKIYILNYLGFSVFENGKFKNYKYFNNENDTFNDFLITKKGNIWFASQKGLILFKDNLFLKFTKNEGLSSSFYSKIFLNTNNEIVVLGNNGVDFIKADLEPITTKPNLIILNKESNKLLKRQTEIGYNQKFLIKAEVVGFQNSKSTLEYKLNNQNWTRLNTNLYDFSNFSSGNYQIQFRLKNPFSNYTYSQLYFIKKKPVWYLRWFVIVPSILLILMGFGILMFLRIRQLQKRNQKLQNLLESNEKLEFQLNEMRYNIAQDFHDELGNKLAGISVLSDKLLNDNELKENTNYPIVERIHKDSQDLFQGIRDFIWAIDSKNGTLEELIFALTDFGESLFEYSNIKFIVDNQVENAKFLLPNFWNRQLLLLFKEAMTNTYKHSKANKLDLVFKIDDAFLIIECNDNGIGFNQKNLTRQNGLLNLKKRVDKLKSKLMINSKLGTSVKFIGKIN